MQWAQPSFLWGLLAIPLMLALYFWGKHQQKQDLQKMVSLALQPGIVPQEIRILSLFRMGLLLLGFTLGVLALAQPQWGFQWQEVHQRGTDIIIAIDLSQSMLAQDVSPDRLTRAKREVTDLLQIIEGDPVGLIAFAGTSFLQSPLTLDYGAIQIFLDSLDTSLIPVQGTAIASVLQTATQAFAKTPPESRALILITDGEDHSENTSEALRLANAEGIQMFVIGVGKTEGAPIPLAEGGFLKGPDGSMVLSKLNPAYLQKLASETRGSYVTSVATDSDSKQIYFDAIKGLTTSQELKMKRRKLWNERFQWFLGITFFCWFIEPLLASSTGKTASLFKRTRKSQLAGKGRVE